MVNKYNHAVYWYNLCCTFNIHEIIHSESDFYSLYQQFELYSHKLEDVVEKTQEDLEYEKEHNDMMLSSKYFISHRSVPNKCTFHHHFYHPSHQMKFSILTSLPYFIFQTTYQERWWKDSVTPLKRTYLRCKS